MRNGRGSKTCKETVDDVCAYVMANLSDSNLSVMQLANKQFLNEDYLARIFKREMGISLKRFIISKRMELATELLGTLDISVAEVADRVGYSSYGYFVAAYKKHFGRTPTNVKKRK
ncbi:MAG: AraC family transcriptional regulator [Clostridiales bacterium]|nr:AraC family transcriptional regulator [Clostridiales bacterium]